jgi:chloramphenicol-sensitive protein RarD
MRKGIWYALAAYGIWGLFPLYWKPLHDVPALQIIGHRIGWSFILLVVIILVTKQWGAFRAAIANRRILLAYTATAVLISINWLVYVWAINAGYIVESSLGYFINPLLSVLLGVIFLREKLRTWQWLPVALAALGVIIVSVSYGSFPWISISLALSFGLYGLVKKKAPLNSLYGLTLETGIVFVPALIYLITVDVQGQGAFLHTDIVSNLLMIGAGAVTAIPLMLFSSAAQRIPLSMVGILQYITPTTQFLLGVFLYKEPFTPIQLVGFSLVWLALIFFTIEGFVARRARQMEPVAAAAD